MGLRRTAVSVVGGPGLAVGAAASVEATLHGPHAAHPHGLVECIALVLKRREVKICNINQVLFSCVTSWGWWHLLYFIISRNKQHRLCNYYFLVCLCSTQQLNAESTVKSQKNSWVPTTTNTIPFPCEVVFYLVFTKQPLLVQWAWNSL